jgi:hypothetical protein
MRDISGAGIYYYQDNIDFHQSINPFPDPNGPHGSWNYLTSTITISTVPTQFIQGPVRAYLSEAPVIAGGTTVIETQPTKENNYTVRLQTVDPSANPRISTHYYVLNLQQVMPITVTWGDWPLEDLDPITATITLSTISVGTGQPTIAPSGTQPYTIYSGGTLSYNVVTTNLDNGTLYYNVKNIGVGRIPASDQIFSAGGYFTATTTLSNGQTQNSYGTVGINNKVSQGTFIISSNTASFRGINNSVLITALEIYRSPEHTSVGLLDTGPLIKIIPPNGSYVKSLYKGGSNPIWGGDPAYTYDVVANGDGSVQLINPVLIPVSGSGGAISGDGGGDASGGADAGGADAGADGDGDGGGDGDA